MLAERGCLSGLVAASCRAARPSWKEGEGRGLAESGRLGLGVRMRRLFGSSTGDARLVVPAFCTKSHMFRARQLHEALSRLSKCQ